VSFQEILSALILGFNHFVLVYFLVLYLTYGMLLCISFSTILSHMREWEWEWEWEGGGTLQSSNLLLPISIVAPAYNEEKTVVQSVRALMALEYPNYEVIVVNDGSRDATVERLVEAFEMYEVAPSIKRDLPNREVRALYVSRLHDNLLLVDKENGGKSDALNAGINVATCPLVCAIDADTLIERDALRRLVRPFLLAPERVVAVGASIRIANGCEVDRGRIVRTALSDNPIPVFQVVEYLRAFLFGRSAWNHLGGHLIISGALGLFRKEAMVEVGGYATDTVGEDMEIVTRLHRHYREAKKDYEVCFIPDPAGWTEAPENLTILARQRDRWQRGLLETLTRHAPMILNPRYGLVGMFTMPFFVFIEAMAPLVETVGLAMFAVALFAGIVDLGFAVLFFLVAFGLGVLLSVTSLALEEISFHRYPRPGDLWRLVGYAVLENFGYRQLTAWWRLKGIWNFLRGKKSWGKMERKGFTAAGTPGARPRGAPRKGPG
jgi:cellulose synthase/poly-beta-1,6-N-acetylglucosamine synthase-like glycosyltransferase